MLKNKLVNLILIIDIAILFIWPVIVFFPWIYSGIILLIGFGLIGAILYESYKFASYLEHKIIH